MPQGYVFKGRVLCELCYEKETDIERLRGEEIPLKKVLEGEECQRCKGPLEESEDILGGVPP